MQTWQNLVEDGSVRWLKYSFASWGTANTMAIRQDDRSWLIVSPSSAPSDEIFDALEAEGNVVGLIAPNAYHYFGQKAWRNRFPKAVSYAPQDSLTRLAIKSPGIDFQPIEALQAHLPPHIEVVLPEGMKAPDLMLCATATGKNVWFTGDLLSNLGPEDLALPIRAMMSLFGGATGFRLNKAPSMVYLQDKARWKTSVLKAFERKAPNTILPAHGNPVMDNVFASAKTILSVS